MTAYIQNTPRNPLMGALADNLAKAKRYGNKYEVKDWVPLIGGTGLGDMFMQEAPELADDVSYYGPSALMRGGNVATGGIGTFAPDKRTFDAAMLGLDVAGVGKGLGSLGKTAGQAGLRKLFSYPESESRREFLKRGAALGGAAAIGLPLVYAGRKAVKPVTHQFDSLKAYNDSLNEGARFYTKNGIIKDPNRAKSYLAGKHESLYNEHVGLEKEFGRVSVYPGEDGWKIAGDDEILDAFSPLAKKQMSKFKENRDASGNPKWNELDDFVKTLGE